MHFGLQLQKLFSQVMANGMVIHYSHACLAIFPTSSVGQLSLCSFGGIRNCQHVSKVSKPKSYAYSCMSMSRGSQANPPVCTITALRLHQCILQRKNQKMPILNTLVEQQKNCSLLTGSTSSGLMTNSWISVPLKNYRFDGYAYYAQNTCILSLHAGLSDPAYSRLDIQFRA